MREFFGSTIWEEMHGYRNVLRAPGASTIIHAHAFPHVAVFWLGSEEDRIQYDVTAFREGREEKLTIHPLFPELPRVPLGQVEVAARTPHRIGLRSGNEGAFICLFMRYDRPVDYSPRYDPLIASQF